MRSPDSRVLPEWVLRAIAIAAIALALREAWQPPPSATPRSRSVDGARVLEALRTPSRDTLVVRTDSALGPLARDWMRARAAAGTPTLWTGAVPSVAVTLDAPRDPNGSAQLRTAAPSGTVLTVRDSLGMIDSIQLAAAATTLDVGTPLGATVIRLAQQPLTLRVPASDSLPTVSVIGRAGWEAKFVVAALEEQGWRVSTRLLLRPDTAVTQGSPTLFDPSRTAVVVALDESAAPFASRLSAFVRSGGGLVLGADALGSPAFATLRPGAPGTVVDAEVLTITDSAPRRALALRPSVRLITDAVALETRRGAVAMAARRFGAGRVVSAGYSDSWRWRMTGPDGAEGRYRQWWSRVVAAARADATVDRSPSVQTQAAPRVEMTMALGPSVPDVARAASNGPLPDPVRRWRWALVAGAALVLEWVLRRVRGAR
jgi:hypothetical protein